MIILLDPGFQPQFLNQKLILVLISFCHSSSQLISFVTVLVSFFFTCLLYIVLCLVNTFPILHAFLIFKIMKYFIYASYKVYGKHMYNFLKKHTHNTIQLRTQLLPIFLKSPCDLPSAALGKPLLNFVLSIPLLFYMALPHTVSLNIVYFLVSKFNINGILLCIFLSF